jgi:hypothetical protein
MTAATEAPVSGRARDAAAGLLMQGVRDAVIYRGVINTAERVRSGRCDHHPWVKAFARFERDTLASLQQPQPIEGEWSC